MNSERMMMPRVAIVIVVWNGKADTMECLQSLDEDRYPNKEIIVVDNGSTDDSVAEIRRSFQSVVILQTGSNLGFTGGNNIGIRCALERQSDYIFLLNNDTTVEPDAMEQLVAAAEAEPDYGLLAPVIHCFYPPREIWFAGSRLELHRGAAWHDNSRQPDRDQPPYEVPWATGCAMLIPSRLLRDLGGFDDRYYLSWEDVDLCLRIRKAGYAVAAVPAARIYHKGGRSGQRMPEGKYYYTVRNSLLLVRKHADLLPYIVAALRIMWLSLRNCRRLYNHERGEVQRYMRTTFDGVRDHLLGRYGAYRSR